MFGDVLGNSNHPSPHPFLTQGMAEGECAMGRPFEVLIQAPSSVREIPSEPGLAAPVCAHSYSGVTEAEGP